MASRVTSMASPAVLGSFALGQPHFLVCYSHASSLSCLLGRSGVLLPTWVFGHRCHAVRTAAGEPRLAVCNTNSLSALHTPTAHATMNDDAEMRDAPARPSLKRPLSSDGVGSLPSKLFAATLAGSPSPSPRHRVVSLAGIKRSRSGDDDLPSKRQLKEEAQERRRQLLAAPLPAPDVYAPEPPTRAPTPAPEPTVPATWLDLMRSLQADGASPYPLPPRARRPPR